MVHSQAPRYLADHLTPASDVASRLRLHSTNRQLLLRSYPAVDLTHTAVEFSQLLVQLSGTRYLTNPKIQRMVLTVSNSSSRQSCTVSTNVNSALEVFLKRYALYKSTCYLLTYLHTYLPTYLLTYCLPMQTAMYVIHDDTERLF